MGNSSASCRSIIIAILILGANTRAISGEDKVLLIDGKLRTHDLPLEGSRVVVERNDIHLGMITDDLSHIRLLLDLQQVYVLSFEHAGCLTKKIVFDTHVPLDELAGAPFTFPFLVTLKKHQLDLNLHYAGPVGYVRFFPDKQDFDYDTNYALSRDRKQKKARSERMSQYTAFGSEGKWSTTDTAWDNKSSETDRSFSPTDGSYGSRLGGQDLPLDTRIMHEESTPGAETHAKQGGEPVDHISRHVTAGPAVIHPATVCTEADQTLPPDERTELLLVEKARVTMIVRITTHGKTKEFRRISHRYGDIHCFCDGVSCGEAAYQAGVDPE